MDEIKQLTAWLREGPDLVSARLAYLIREHGVETKTLICVKIFPDLKEPTGGVIITSKGSVFQFGYNSEGMIFELAKIDVWLNITSTYHNHPWRDEILSGLAMLTT
jgi:hypothetical protein